MDVFRIHISRLLFGELFETWFVVVGWKYEFLISEFFFFFFAPAELKIIGRWLLFVYFVGTTSTSITALKSGGYMYCIYPTRGRSATEGEGGDVK